MTSNVLNRTLAERLDALMKARGLSNNELGRMAGVAPNTVANYRDTTSQAFTASGKPRSAKLSEIQSIAGALNVNPLSLLSSSEPLAASEPPAAYGAELTLTPLERDLVLAIRKLPEGEQVDTLRDVMHRAELIEQLVMRALSQRGIDVTGYVSATRAAETLPAPPARPEKIPDRKPGEPDEFPTPMTHLGRLHAKRRSGGI